METNFVFEVTQTVTTTIRNKVYIKAHSYEEARKIALQAYKDGGGANGSALDGFEASNLCKVAGEELLLDTSEYGDDSTLYGYVPSEEPSKSRWSEIEHIADYYDGLYETHIPQTEGEQS